MLKDKGIWWATIAIVVSLLGLFVISRNSNSNNPVEAPQEQTEEQEARDLIDDYNTRKSEAGTVYSPEKELSDLEQKLEQEINEDYKVSVLVDLAFAASQAGEIEKAKTYAQAALDSIAEEDYDEGNQAIIDSLNSIAQKGSL